MHTSSIKETFEAYLEQFPNEAANFPLLHEQLGDSESLTSRKNMKGHVTASGIIVSGDNILLIFHNKLKRYIQPGGHIEDVDSAMWQAATREVLEETGIAAKLHPWHEQHGYIPIHIDTHAIPANPKRDEGDHFHHDWIFVFQVTDANVTLQAEEVSDFKWVPLVTDFTHEPAIKGAVEKIRKIL